MINEFILSKEDISTHIPLYETLNIINHRHKINNDKILYIDSKNGALLPFLGLNKKSSIDYKHITTNSETIKNNPLLKNIHNYVNLIKKLYNAIKMLFGLRQFQSQVLNPGELS